MSKCLSVEDIREIDDKGIEKVIVPEWNNDHVYIKAMTGDQWAEFEKISLKKSPEGIMFKLLIWCVCDENGDSLFEDKHIPLLRKKSVAALQRIANVIMERNLVTEDKIEAEAKN